MDDSFLIVLGLPPQKLLAEAVSLSDSDDGGSRVGRFARDWRRSIGGTGNDQRTNGWICHGFQKTLTGFLQSLKLQILTR